MSKQFKILITGGAGFIGSHVVIEAINRNYEVWNLDSLTYAANLKNLNSVQNNKNYHFIKGDICDKLLLTDLFNKVGFDYVIHLAAESHVDISINNPDIFIKTNVLGTHNLLKCSRSTQVKKFIHVSTDEVYGDLENNDLPFTENHPLKPNSPYSASKASSDLLVRSYFKTYNFPACITRCSNNFGPHQDDSKFIPVIINQAKQNKNIPVYGTGKNIRDWLFVKDHVQALFTVLDKGKLGDVYNIGANNEQQNINIVKLILKIMNRSEDLIEFVDDRLGHDWRYSVNSSKIQTELGWTSSMNFNNALEETVFNF
jgi:dTDP-glucose 4,6-dehydratase